MLYFAVLAFGTYQTFSPGFDSQFARMQSERGDGMLNHYILEHSWQCVSNSDYCGSLFSPPCFYPERFTLWYSEHLLGVAPAYWALRLFLPYDLAFHWWQILLDAMNYIAFALVVRWLGGSHILAMLGGYLWAFALVHVEQIKHQQMIPRFWMPLAAYYAWSFALVPTTRSLNRMLCFVFLQCIACVYTGWFLILGLAIFLPLGLASRPATKQELLQFVRENRTRLLAIVGGWCGALAIAFVPYVIINWGKARAYEECFGMMPTPSAWLTGPPGSRWEHTTALFRSPVQEECSLFCGFGIYALFLAASADLLVVRLPNRRTAELSLAAAGLLTAALCALATSTPYDAGPSLWQFVRHIPGGGAIRCVTRVYVTVYLFGLLSSLVWLNAVTVHLRPWIRVMILGPIAAALIFEQTGFEPPSFEKKDFYGIADRLAIQLQGADAGYVIPVVTDTKGHVSKGLYGDVVGMWVGLRANVPIVNGYSGRWPANHPHIQIATDDMLREWLRGRFHGKLAIIDPDHPEAFRTIWIE